MYAVIETGGKQYKVEVGDVITVEKLGLEAGEPVTFDKVLFLNDDREIKVGTPYLDAVKVMGTVLENGKGKKVVIFKYKAKKNYRKKRGHRQPYTKVQIESLNGEVPEKEEPEEAPACEAPAEETPAEDAEMPKEEAPAAEDMAAEMPKEEAPAAEEAAEKPAEKPVKKVSASMKKDELIAFAKENNIEIDEKSTKAVIIETIEAAMK